jgi:DNA-binding Lrp family transcriptional regulator
MDKKGVVLKFITDKAPVNTSVDISFSRFSEETGISKEELDDLLKELENDRYISQFVLENDDVFKVNVNEKALTYPKEVA